MMQRFSLLFPLFICVAIASAQSDRGSCRALIEQFYTTASEACLGPLEGHFCNGGSAPQTLPQVEGFDTVGAVVPVNDLSAIQSPLFETDASAGGLVWMRDTNTQMSGLLIGQVRVTDVTPPETDFPQWTAMNVLTAEASPDCIFAPRSAFVVQSTLPFEIISSTRMVINGISVDLRGTVMIHTIQNQTYFIVLEGEVRVIAGGETRALVTGQQSVVPHATNDFSRPDGVPSFAAPFDPELIRNFPVALMDRATILPQPGYVSTLGDINMRTEPALDGPLMFSVPAGQNMTVLGQDETGTWYHVRLATGETGWMFAQLLRQNMGEIAASYQATPVPPQRYGSLGTQARTSADLALTLRVNPSIYFDAMGSLEPRTDVTLLARSPYSPFVKVDANGVVGWVGLDGLETQSLIWALPIDYNVPPPPTPPPIPGSFGGAFPDPDCFPDC